jgi:hypothetical protein
MKRLQSTKRIDPENFARIAADPWRFGLFRPVSGLAGRRRGRRRPSPSHGREARSGMVMYDFPAYRCGSSTGMIDGSTHLFPV